MSGAAEKTWASDGDGHVRYECQWCYAHTHVDTETAAAIKHAPDCFLVELGVVSSDSPSNPPEGT